MVASIAIVDASNLSFRQAHAGRKKPNCEWLFAVTEEIEKRLENERTILVFDASVFGWLRRICSQQHGTQLDTMRKEGTLTVAPARKEADAIVLRAAKKHRAVVVSNDAFSDAAYRELRVGVPILRVSEVLDEPLASVRLCIYRSANHNSPVELEDASIRAHLNGTVKDHPREGTTVPRTGSAPSNDPSSQGLLARIAASLTELDASGQGIPLSKLAAKLDLEVLGFSMKVRNAIGGPKTGRFHRLLASDPTRFRLWRAGAVAMVAPAGESQGVLDTQTNETPDLTTTEVSHRLVQLAQGGKIDLATANQLLTKAFGARLEALVLERVGRRKKGVWRDFCTNHLPGWSVVRVDDSVFHLERS